MKAYNVTCPICGTINQDLNLEETDGWMECEHCKQLSRVQPTQTKEIPIFTPVIPLLGSQK